jgi:hypothetical protein
MLIIAAIAFGLWANRMDWPLIAQAPLRNLMKAPWRKWPDFCLFLAILSLNLSLPYLAALTVICLSMRFFEPIPHCRPGTAACMAACAGMIVALGSAAPPPSGADERIIPAPSQIIPVPLPGPGNTRSLIVNQLFAARPSGMMFFHRVGITVAGAWFALWIFGLWHLERSWIDRLGRALGWAWIAIAVAVWALTFL